MIYIKSQFSSSVSLSRFHGIKYGLYAFYWVLIQM